LLFDLLQLLQVLLFLLVELANALLMGCLLPAQIHRRTDQLTFLLLQLLSQFLQLPLEPFYLLSLLAIILPQRLNLLSQPLLLLEFQLVEELFVLGELLEVLPLQL
jgi:hypothetical protein